MAYRETPTKDIVLGPSNIFCRLFGHKHGLKLKPNCSNTVTEVYGVKEYVFAFHAICVRCGTPYMQGIPLTSTSYPYDNNSKYFYLDQKVSWIKKQNIKFWNWALDVNISPDTVQIHFKEFKAFTSFDEFYEFLNTNDLIVKKPWHQSYDWLRFDLDEEHFAVCKKTLQVVNLNDLRSMGF